MKSLFRRILLNFHRVVHSIRFRLTIWAVVILAIVFAAFSTFVYSRQVYDVRSQAASYLVNDFPDLSNFYLHAISSYILGLSPLPDVTQQIAPFLTNNEFIVLLDPQSAVLQQINISASSNLPQMLAFWNKNPNAINVAFSYSLTGVGRNPKKTPVDYAILIEALHPERNSLLGFLVIGEPIDPAGSLNSLLLTLVLASAATLLAVLFGGYWLVGRALLPVKAITHTAQEIGETDLSRRLNLNTQDELGELANTFDQMLNRLEAAFNRQRQFTADASHELRTPLTIIDLEAERALARRRPPEEYERALHTIRSENEFMAHLVNDLLTLAWMDAGQAKMKMEELDLSEVVLDVVERLAPLARQKKVEVIMGDLPNLILEGDRQFLSQMALNLVENAIKYSTGNDRRVSVETGCDQSVNNNQAWLRVSDTGPGIPAENLPFIFDRFYRVDKARSRTGNEQEELGGETSPSGSGLGLSIVQWITIAHGGQVSVQSEVGKGSVFEVRLPLKDNRPHSPIVDHQPDHNPILNPDLRNDS